MLSDVHDADSGSEGGPSAGSRRAARVGARLLAALALLPFVSVAAAHTGTTHAGTPHWLLLVAVVVGLAVVLASAVAVRRQAVAARTGVLGLLAGFLVGGVGGIGLVEIQVVASEGPSAALLGANPTLSLVVGTAVVLGSYAVGLLYWPTRPSYPILGSLLGAWILYPVVMPVGGVMHPLGYLLVLAVPVAAGYVVYRDAWPALRAALARQLPRRVFVASALLAAVFLAFSAGTLTLNPDDGVGVPDHAFVAFLSVADPLVLWPAVEVYLPAIPAFGMVSIGTVILFGMLGGLLGLNTALIADEVQARDASLSPGFLAGTITSTGTTACCCCAPAMYGVVSAVFGASATPIYWSFMDTSSPLSSTFLAASVLLLTASIVRTAGARGEDAACAVPAE